jgi:hypothetical protein
MSLKVVFIASFIFAGLFFGAVFFLPAIDIQEKIAYNVTVDYVEQEEYVVQVPVVVQVPYEVEELQEEEVVIINENNRVTDNLLMDFDFNLPETFDVVIDWTSDKEVLCFSLLEKEDLDGKIDSINMLLEFYSEEPDTLFLYLESILSESYVFLFNQGDFHRVLNLDAGEYGYFFIVVNSPNSISHEVYYVTSELVTVQKIREETSLVNETRYLDVNKTRIETRYRYDPKRVSIWFKLMNP